MQSRTKIGLLLIICSNSFFSPVTFGQSRRVMGYIDEVQEERRSTRWTLTEWLHIKERMKMMDIWAAMFSDPKKDKFSPELSLQYGQGLTLTEFQGSSRPDLFQKSSVTETLQPSSEQGRIQFWFTNLVSSSTGLRTLDIDLGIEGGFSNRFGQGTLKLSSEDSVPLSFGTARFQRAGVNFRLFGANVQDSFLLAKVGKFERQSGFRSIQPAADNGNYYGGEVAFYLLPFLGIEGEYLKLLAANQGGIESTGHSSSYGVFLEVVNIRLIASRYQQSFSQESNNFRLDSKDSSQLLSLRLYF